MTLELDKEKKKNMFFQMNGDIKQFEAAYSKENNFIWLVVEKMLETSA